MPITLVTLDADDTLWHRETLFRLARERFAALLGEFAAPEPLPVLPESLDLGMKLMHYAVEPPLSVCAVGGAVCAGAAGGSDQGRVV